MTASSERVPCRRPEGQIFGFGASKLQVELNEDGNFRQKTAWPLRFNHRPSHHEATPARTQNQVSMFVLSPTAMLREHLMDQAMRGIAHRLCVEVHVYLAGCRMLKVGSISIDACLLVRAHQLVHISGICSHVYFPSFLLPSLRTLICNLLEKAAFCSY